MISIESETLFDSIKASISLNNTFHFESLFVWIFGLKIHLTQLIKNRVSLDDLGHDVWDPASTQDSLNHLD